MLTRSIIKQETIKKVFDKGEYIQQCGASYMVSQESYFENGIKVTEISASVRGSRGKVYDVTLKIDEQHSDISYCHCGCEAFYNYAGMCKHCVATALEYLDKRDGKYVNRKPVQGAYGRQMISIKRDTTKGFRYIMEKYGNMEQSLSLVIQKEENVRLEAHLTLQYGKASIDFKIGNTQMYVLKNLIDFASAVKNNASIKYGQKLEFVHRVDAFVEDSRPLIKFIQKEIEKYLDDSKAVYSYHRPNFRNWELKMDSFDSFMAAVGEKGFRGDIENFSSHTWTIVNEFPKESLLLSGSKEGVTLQSEYMAMYIGLEFFYFFKERCVYKVNREKLAEVEDFLLYLSQIQGSSCFISKEDLPLFCRDMLPVLEKYFEFEMKDFNKDLYLPPSVSFEMYLDAPQKDYITCKLLAVYGEEKYNVFQQTKQTRLRDASSERKMNHLVASYFNTYDPNEEVMVLSQDDDRIYELLTDGIARFQVLGQVFVSDAIKSTKIIATPKIAVGVSLSGDLLELSLSSDEMPMEQLIAMLSKYDRKKKYYRLKDGNYINLDEDGIAILTDLKNGLNLKYAQMKTGTVVLPKYRALYLDSKLKDMQGLPVQKNKDFKALIRNMKTIEDNDFEVPASLEQVVREYQKRGFLWIKTIQYNGFGGILADDMGLGKTLQVISFLLSEHLEAKSTDNRRSLIVCPASLVYNWKSEIDRFANKLPCVMIVGSAEERRELIENSSTRDILITSYDLLKRDLEVYENIQFHCEVIDEAQYIKNHTTRVSKAVKEIHAGFRLALTGTPVENRISELWSIFDYLMPGFLYGYQRFREELEIPITQNGEEEAIFRLQRMIRPFILRRLKKDVLTDLPDKIEENVYAILDGEQKKLYEAHVQRIQMMLNKQTDQEFSGSRFQVLAEITKLRQLCCDPSLLFDNYKESSAKADMCIDLIENAISGGHKILLFSQFTSMIEKLQQRMTEKNINFYTLTGATSKENRIKLVEEFNHNEIPVFCISLKAGGTGLNLTAADIVIHYDPWWNIAVQNQATDRAHRIGQKNVVTVYKLIAKGTIEENIVKLQDMKRDLAEQILESDHLSHSSFSKEELLSLL
ncbi:MAG TPA: DEAD/DEAH box helicase [Lachnospiraceae bacterium]|nr:DEAD/DEAH box helicase [Lachnospiraceae bacterium]